MSSQAQPSERSWRGLTDFSDLFRAGVLALNRADYLLEPVHGLRLTLNGTLCLTLATPASLSIPNTTPLA
jgi:hypothetical protein